MTGTISGYYVLGRDPQLRFTTDLLGTGTVNARLLGGPGQQYGLNELSSIRAGAGTRDAAVRWWRPGGRLGEWRRGRPNRLRY